MKGNLKNKASAGIVVLVCLPAMFQFFIPGSRKNITSSISRGETPQVFAESSHIHRGDANASLIQENKATLSQAGGSLQAEDRPLKVSSRQFKIAEHCYPKRNYFLTGNLRARDGSKIPEAWGEIRIFLDPINPEHGVEPTEKSFYQNCRYDRQGKYSLKLNIEDWKDKRGVIVFRDHFRREIMFYQEIGPFTSDLKLDITLHSQFSEAVPFFTDLPADIRLTSISMTGRRGHVDVWLREQKVMGARDGDILILGVESKAHGGSGYIRGSAKLRGSSVQILASPISWRVVNGVLRDGQGLPYRDAFLQLNNFSTSTRSNDQGEFRLIFTHDKSTVSLNVYDRFFDPDKVSCGIPVPILERDLESFPKNLTLDLQIPGLK